MDTSRTHRVACEYCGRHQVLRVTATQGIEHVSIGDQFSGAPAANRQQLAGFRRPDDPVPPREKGDITYTARHILSDPKQNLIVRLSRYVRRYVRKKAD